MKEEICILRPRIGSRLVTPELQVSSDVVGFQSLFKFLQLLITRLMFSHCFEITHIYGYSICWSRQAVCYNVVFTSYVLCLSHILRYNWQVTLLSVWFWWIATLVGWLEQLVIREQYDLATINQMLKMQHSFISSKQLKVKRWVFPLWLAQFLAEESYGFRVSIPHLVKCSTNSILGTVCHQV